MPRNKRLTPAQFAQAVEPLRSQQRTIELAYPVLVQGRQQKAVAAEQNCSPGRVSTAVHAVWRAYTQQQAIPAGYVRITAVLPKQKAQIVEQWQKEARAQIDLSILE